MFAGDIGENITAAVQLFGATPHCDLSLNNLDSLSLCDIQFFVEL